MLYQTVYRHLKSQIESGQLQPGQQIATEREIMERFGVSRVTTTRALQLLQSENLITRQPGRGSYVLGGGDGETERLTPLLDESKGAMVPDAKSATMGSVGFIAPFLQYSFGPSIMVAMEEAVNRRGGVLAILCSYGRQDLEEEAIRRLVDSGVTGLVIFPVNGEFYNPQILQLHLQGFPLVLIDKFLPGIPLSYVTTDNRDAAYQLTRHLLDLGHRHIGYFSPNPEGTSTLAERYDGFLMALNEANIEFAEDYFIEPTAWSDPVGSEDAGQREALAIWMATHPEVSAVFASDDELAQGMLAAVRARGLEVPRDFSVVCFDGPPVNSLFWSFTSALQDQATMAKRAIELVCAQADGTLAEAQAVVLPAKIHRGQSSGPVSAYVRP